MMIIGLRLDLFRSFPRHFQMLFVEMSLQVMSKLLEQSL